MDKATARPHTIRGFPIGFHYFPVNLAVVETRAEARRQRGGGTRVDPFRARIPFHDPHFPLRTSHVAPLSAAFGYLHCHPEYEIAYIPEDHGSYMIQDAEIPIAPGDIFIVNANAIHQPIIPRAHNAGALVTYFAASLFGDAEECSQWIQPFLHAAEFGCNKLPADPQLPSLLRQLHATADPQVRNWQIASRGLITHILSIVARLFAERCDASGMSGRIAKTHRFASVVAHINQRLGDRIEAEELYRLAGLSHSRFSEAFRDAFGVSASRYIQIQRLKRAKRLLRSTELSVTEIAFACGFSSISLFNTAFRRELSASPTLYRRQRVAPGSDALS
jgi:AraC-like DNA-binding protein